MDDLKGWVQHAGALGKKAMAFRTKNSTYVVSQNLDGTELVLTKVSSNCGIQAGVPINITSWNLEYDGNFLRFKLFVNGMPDILTSRIVEIYGVTDFALWQTAA